MRAGGLGVPSRRAYSGSSYPSGAAPAAAAPAAAAPAAPTAAATGGKLAWNDNAKWLEQCKASGVVSWFDAGLRLSEKPVPKNFIEKIVEDRKLYSPSNPVRKSSGGKESMAAVNEMKSELAALKEELAKTREALVNLEKK